MWCSLSWFYYFFFLPPSFAAFVELVHSGNGTTQKEKEHGGLQENKQKLKKSPRKGGKKSASVVPSHFIETDVSDVKGETLIFSKMMFCILLHNFGDHNNSCPA